MKKNKINTPCSIFQRQESVIRNITHKINETREMPEKAVLIEALQKEADALLSCLSYNDKRLDCKNYCFIAHLHEKTTNLIIKANRLA